MGILINHIYIYNKLEILIFKFCRYLGRQKGGYYTREDIGTLGARDPDTAVLNGVTGIQF